MLRSFPPSVFSTPAMARLFTLSVLLFVAPHLIISKAVASDGGEEHHGEERVLHGRDLVRGGGKLGRKPN